MTRHLSNCSVNQCADVDMHLIQVTSDDLVLPGVDERVEADVEKVDRAALCRAAHKIARDDGREFGHWRPKAVGIL